jgi:hypothetical protein
LTYIFHCKKWLVGPYIISYAVNYIDRKLNSNTGGGTTNAACAVVISYQFENKPGNTLVYVSTLVDCVRKITGDTYWVPHGILQVVIIIVYENVFQIPVIFRTSISLSPQQSTLCILRILLITASNVCFQWFTSRARREA